jgi:TrmH family RNA methyltransferase
MEREQPVDIRSADNQTIKLVRSLRQRKTREAERLFVVEGERLVGEALARGMQPAALLIREDKRDYAKSLATRFREVPPFRIVATRLFDSISDTVTSQGVIALLPIPQSSIPDVERPLIVVADRIADPGNLGTLIRVAAGAGADALVLTPGSVDPYNPKVVRAGMGAHFQIPLIWFDAAVRTWLTSSCANRVIADASGEADYVGIDWNEPSALIVGPETGEFSVGARALATTSARIPLAEGIESLNAAIAGAVMLFEASRQRRNAQTP